MVSVPIILAEKLRRPEAIGLARPRLERPLATADGPGIDLVVAPAGSGKTTLLARVAQLSPRPTAWYRVTADDAAEPAFVAHLARSLHLATSGQLPSIAAAEQTAPDQLRITDLLSALDSAGQVEALVILDDVHEIAGSQAEAALERFLQLRPPGLRVLIGSRRQPGVNVSRLRVSGLLREVTTDDLRFRSWEVEELFVGVYGEPMSPESAAALTRRTGGWAAALQLFHLATAGRSATERSQMVSDLGGRSRLVRSYLTRNVIADLPADRRLFLVRTSTLGTLTGELCDALLGTTGSAGVLDELEQQQLFTSSDDEGRTFRYHEVLRSHLELALIEEFGGTAAREWYARSAELLQEAGHLRAALRAYARAEDWRAVTRLLRESNGDTGAELQLPAAMVETDPWLSLVEARRRVRSGALADSVSAFRQAELLNDEPEFQRVCRLERSRAQAWTERRSPDPVSPEDATHWSRLIRRATGRGERAQPPGSTGSAVDFAHGVAGLLRGEFTWAAAVLRRTDPGSATPALALLIRLAQGVIGLVTGREASADEAALPVLAADADAEGFAWIARVARTLHEATGISHDGPAWRVALCTSAPDDCARAGDDWGAAVLRLVAGVAAQLAGDPAAAACYAQASRQFTELDAPVLRVWADALLSLCADPADESAAPRAAAVVRDADRYGNAGARAVAMTAQALAAQDSQLAAAADEVAGRCGLRPALVALVAAAPWSRERDRQPAPPPVPQPPSEPRVRVTLFGGFRLDVDDSTVDLSPLRPRSAALLRLLALSAGRDVHREILITALWPTADVTVGTRRLQVAVSSIRQLLEHADRATGLTVVRSGDAYRLQLPTTALVDLRQFTAALQSAETASRHGDLAAATAARERALELYRGDLLPEDGPAEAVAALREQLRFEATAAAAALAADLAGRGRGEDALSAARRAVALDPYQDAPWRLMIDLYSAAGDASAAERTRREHRRAQLELGVPLG